MSVVEPGSAHSDLIQRVKDILLRPSPTWDVIEAEPTSVSQIYRTYVIPLAAIPAVASFIGMAIVGVGIPGFGYKTALIPTLISQIVNYALSLGMIYVLGLIIDGLAPSFGGGKHPLNAFKVAAYSYTAAWVAGVFFLIPMLAPLALAGLYSFYLLYKGLPRLMKTPEDKAVPFIAVIIIIGVLLSLVVFAIVSPMSRSMRGPFAAAPAPAGRVQIGDTEVDVGKLSAAAKQLEAAANGEAGASRAADPAALTPYLPASVAGFARTEVSSRTTGIAGLEASGASATYRKGDARMELTVGDLGAMAAIAAIGGAFNVESTSESNGKVERMGKVDGRMTMEEYDSSSRHGEYAVVVGERFLVVAEGDGVSMDELRAAARAVDFGRLERMAEAGR